jgi:hypothetical protein
MELINSCPRVKAKYAQETQASPGVVSLGKGLLHDEHENCDHEDSVVENSSFAFYGDHFLPVCGNKVCGSDADADYSFKRSCRKPCIREAWEQLLFGFC